MSAAAHQSQLSLPEVAESNVLLRQDLPVHSWYRFVLSYPPHLVRKYAAAFDLGPDSLLLDPFCGTGTTLVEAKKLGIPSIGCDAHPFAVLVSQAKTNWSLPIPKLREKARRIAKLVLEEMEACGLPVDSFSSRLMEESAAPSWQRWSLGEDENKVMPLGFVSERPLARLLILRHFIEQETKRQSDGVEAFFNVALAHVIANGAGNFAFGPEIYRTREKFDYDVLDHFIGRITSMCDDLERMAPNLAATPAAASHDDARLLNNVPEGISAVITSPPYPNEKDYTRTTRVESLLLRFMFDRESLRRVKTHLLRSNTRNVFVADADGDEVAEFKSIQSVCRQIEDRRIELKKTSGFERLYHKVVAHYFGGMRLHLRALKPKLRRRARLAYVVGDQLSFLMVPVATAKLLAEVAEAEGYRVLGIDLWRERVGTKVRNGLNGEKLVRVREEVLLLEKK